MRRGINIDGYFVEWNSPDRKITITPKNNSGSFSFGLGNAKISVDVSNPPDKLVKVIDDDPDFDVNNLRVSIDYGATHLVQPAKDMIKVKKTLKLSNGRSKSIEFYKGDIEQFQKRANNVTVSGIGSYSIGIKTFR